jgi:hypothetical protein
MILEPGRRFAFITAIVYEFMYISPGQAFFGLDWFIMRSWSWSTKGKSPVRVLVMKMVLM